LVVLRSSTTYGNTTQTLRSLTRLAPHSDGLDALTGLTRIVPHSHRLTALRRRTSTLPNTHLSIPIIRFNENFVIHQNITRDFNITRKCLDISRRHMLLLQYNFFDWVSLKKIIGADVKMVC
jgi:hypothetical protein